MEEVERRVRRLDDLAILFHSVTKSESIKMEQDSCVCNPTSQSEKKRSPPVHIWVTTGLLNSRMSGLKLVLLLSLGKERLQWNAGKLGRG